MDSSVRHRSASAVPPLSLAPPAGDPSATVVANSSSNDDHNVTHQDVNEDQRLIQQNGAENRHELRVVVGNHNNNDDDADDKHRKKRGGGGGRMSAVVGSFLRCPVRACRCVCRGFSDFLREAVIDAPPLVRIVNILLISAILVMVYLIAEQTMRVAQGELKTAKLKHNKARQQHSSAKQKKSAASIGGGGGNTNDEYGRPYGNRASAAASVSLKNFENDGSLKHQHNTENRRNLYQPPTLVRGNGGSNQGVNYDDGDDFGDDPKTPLAGGIDTDNKKGNEGGRENNKNDMRMSVNNGEEDYQDNVHGGVLRDRYYDNNNDADDDDDADKGRKLQRRADRDDLNDDAYNRDDEDDYNRARREEGDKHYDDNNDDHGNIYGDNTKDNYRRGGAYSDDESDYGRGGKYYYRSKNTKTADDDIGSNNNKGPWWKRAFKAVVKKIRGGGSDASSSSSSSASSQKEQSGQDGVIEDLINNEGQKIAMNNGREDYDRYLHEGQRQFKKRQREKMRQLRQEQKDIENQQHLLFNGVVGGGDYDRENDDGGDDDNQQRLEALKAKRRELIRAQKKEDNLLLLLEDVSDINNNNNDDDDGGDDDIQSFRDSNRRKRQHNRDDKNDGGGHNEEGEDDPPPVMSPMLLQSEVQRLEDHLAKRRAYVDRIEKIIEDGDTDGKRYRAALEFVRKQQLLKEEEEEEQLEIEGGEDGHDDVNNINQEEGGNERRSRFKRSRRREERRGPPSAEEDAEVQRLLAAEDERVGKEALEEKNVVSREEAEIKQLKAKIAKLQRQTRQLKKRETIRRDALDWEEEQAKQIESEREMHRLKWEIQRRKFYRWVLKEEQGEGGGGDSQKSSNNNVLLELPSSSSSSSSGVSGKSNNQKNKFVHQIAVLLGVDPSSIDASSSAAAANDDGSSFSSSSSSLLLATAGSDDPSAAATCPGMRPTFPWMPYDTFLRTTVAQPEYAYVTFITDPSYVRLAATLMYSIAVSGSLYSRCILVTKGDISPFDQAQLALFAHVIEIDPIPSPLNIDNPQYKETFTKLRIWELEPLYTKVLYIDADVLVTKNMDDLFDIGIGGMDGAAFGAEWATPLDADQSRFSTGMMLLHPSLEIFDRMMISLKEDTTMEMMELPDLLFLKLFFEKVWPETLAKKNRKMERISKIDQEKLDAFEKELIRQYGETPAPFQYNQYNNNNYQSYGGYNNKNYNNELTDKSNIDGKRKSDDGVSGDDDKDISVLRVPAAQISLIPRWYQVYQGEFGRHYASYLTHRRQKITIFDTRVHGIHYPGKSKPWQAYSDEGAIKSVDIEQFIDEGVLKLHRNRNNINNNKKSKDEDDSSKSSEYGYGLDYDFDHDGGDNDNDDVNGNGASMLDTDPFGRVSNSADSAASPLLNYFEEKMKKYSIAFCAWKDYVRYFHLPLATRRYGELDNEFWRTNSRWNYNQNAAESAQNRNAMLEKKERAKRLEMENQMIPHFNDKKKKGNENADSASSSSRASSVSAADFDDQAPFLPLLSSHAAAKYYDDTPLLSFPRGYQRTVYQHRLDARQSQLKAINQNNKNRAKNPNDKNNNAAIESLADAILSRLDHHGGGGGEQSSLSSSKDGRHLHQKQLVNARGIPQDPSDEPYLFSKHEARDRGRPFDYDAAFWWFLYHKQMLNAMKKIVAHRRAINLEVFGGDSLTIDDVVLTAEEEAEALKQQTQKKKMVDYNDEDDSNEKKSMSSLAAISGGSSTSSSYSSSQVRQLLKKAKLRKLKAMQKQRALRLKDVSLDARAVRYHTAAAAMMMMAANTVGGGGGDGINNNRRRHDLNDVFGAHFNKRNYDEDDLDGDGNADVVNNNNGDLLNSDDGIENMAFDENGNEIRNDGDDVDGRNGNKKTRAAGQQQRTPPLNVEEGDDKGINWKLVMNDTPQGFNQLYNNPDYTYRIQLTLGAAWGYNQRFFKRRLKAIKREEWMLSLKMNENKRNNIEEEPQQQSSSSSSPLFLFDFDEPLPFTPLPLHGASLSSIVSEWRERIDYQKAKEEQKKSIATNKAMKELESEYRYHFSKNGNRFDNGNSDGNKNQFYAGDGSYRLDTDDVINDFNNYYRQQDRHQKLSAEANSGNSKRNDADVEVLYPSSPSSPLSPSSISGPFFTFDLPLPRRSSLIASDTAANSGDDDGSNSDHESVLIAVLETLLRTPSYRYRAGGENDDENTNLILASVARNAAAAATTTTATTKSMAKHHNHRLHRSLFEHLWIQSAVNHLTLVNGENRREEEGGEKKDGDSSSSSLFSQSNRRRHEPPLARFGVLISDMLSSSSSSSQHLHQQQCDFSAEVRSAIRNLTLAFDSEGKGSDDDDSHGDNNEDEGDNMAAEQQRQGGDEKAVQAPPPPLLRQQQQRKRGNNKHTATTATAALTYTEAQRLKRLITEGISAQKACQEMLWTVVREALSKEKVVFVGGSRHNSDENADDESHRPRQTHAMVLPVFPSYSASSSSSSASPTAISSPVDATADWWLSSASASSVTTRYLTINDTAVIAGGDDDGDSSQQQLPFSIVDGNDEDDAGGVCGSGSNAGRFSISISPSSNNDHDPEAAVGIASLKPLSSFDDEREGGEAPHGATVDDGELMMTGEINKVFLREEADLLMHMTDRSDSNLAAANNPFPNNNNTSFGSNGDSRRKSSSGVRTLQYQLALSTLRSEVMHFIRHFATIDGFASSAVAEASSSMMSRKTEGEERQDNNNNARRREIIDESDGNADDQSESSSSSNRDGVTFQKQLEHITASLLSVNGDDEGNDNKDHRQRIISAIEKISQVIDKTHSQISILLRDGNNNNHEVGVKDNGLIQQHRNNLKQFKKKLVDLDRKEKEKEAGQRMHVADDDNGRGGDDDDSIFNAIEPLHLASLYSVDFSNMDPIILKLFTETEREEEETDDYADYDSSGDVNNKNNKNDDVLLKEDDADEDINQKPRAVAHHDDNEIEDYDINNGGKRKESDDEEEDQPRKRMRRNLLQMGGEREREEEWEQSELLRKLDAIGRGEEVDDVEDVLVIDKSKESAGSNKKKKKNDDEAVDKNIENSNNANKMFMTQGSDPRKKKRNVSDGGASVVGVDDGSLHSWVIRWCNRGFFGSDLFSAKSTTNTAAPSSSSSSSTQVLYVAFKPSFVFNDSASASMIPPHRDDDNINHRRQLLSINDNDDDFGDGDGGNDDNGHLDGEYDEGARFGRAYSGNNNARRRDNRIVAAATREGENRVKKNHNKRESILRLDFDEDDDDDDEGNGDEDNQANLGVDRGNGDGEGDNDNPITAGVSAATKRTRRPTPPPPTVEALSSQVDRFLQKLMNEKKPQQIAAGGAGVASPTIEEEYCPSVAKALRKNPAKASLINAPAFVSYYPQPISAWSIDPKTAKEEEQNNAAAGDAATVYCALPPLNFAHRLSIIPIWVSKASAVEDFLNTNDHHDDENSGGENGKASGDADDDSSLKFDSKHVEFYRYLQRKYATPLLRILPNKKGKSKDASSLSKEESLSVFGRLSGLKTAPHHINAIDGSDDDNGNGDFDKTAVALGGVMFQSTTFEPNPQRPHQKKPSSSSSPSSSSVSYRQKTLEVIVRCDTSSIDDPSAISLDDEFYDSSSSSNSADHNSEQPFSFSHSYFAHVKHIKKKKSSSNNISSITRYRIYLKSKRACLLRRQQQQRRGMGENRKASSASSPSSMLMKALWTSTQLSRLQSLLKALVASSAAAAVSSRNDSEEEGNSGNTNKNSLSSNVLLTTSSSFASHLKKDFVEWKRSTYTQYLTTAAPISSGGRGGDNAAVSNITTATTTNFAALQRGELLVYSYPPSSPLLARLSKSTTTKTSRSSSPSSSAASLPPLLSPSSDSVLRLLNSRSDRDPINGERHDDFDPPADEIDTVIDNFVDNVITASNGHKISSSPSSTAVHWFQIADQSEGKSLPQSVRTPQDLLSMMMTNRSSSSSNKKRGSSGVGGQAMHEMSLNTVREPPFSPSELEKVISNFYSSSSPSSPRHQQQYNNDARNNNYYGGRRDEMIGGEESGWLSHDVALKRRKAEEEQRRRGSSSRAEVFLMEKERRNEVRGDDDENNENLAVVEEKPAPVSLFDCLEFAEGHKALVVQYSSYAKDGDDRNNNNDKENGEGVEIVTVIEEGEGGEKDFVVHNDDNDNSQNNEKTKLINDDIVIAQSSSSTSTLHQKNPSLKRKKMRKEMGRKSVVTTHCLILLPPQSAVADATEKTKAVEASYDLAFSPAMRNPSAKTLHLSSIESFFFTTAESTTDIDDSDAGGESSWADGKIRTNENKKKTKQSKEDGDDDAIEKLSRLLSRIDGGRERGIRGGGRGDENKNLAPVGFDIFIRNVFRI